MKHSKLKLIASLALIGAMAPSLASAKSIKVGTGGESGNYFAMTKDIDAYCAEDLTDRTLEIYNTAGSVENLLGMQNKTYSVGLVQEDVLQYYAKRSPSKVNTNRMKVVTGLHKEAVHLLIPKGYKPKSAEKSGSWRDFFNKDKDVAPKIELSMLKNQIIGSWGGSMISAEALSYFFDLNLNVLEVPQAKRNPNNTAAPLLLVGGHPYKVVEEYLATNKWHLVALDYDAISKTAGFYTRESVNYSINGKVIGTPTIGVQALMVGKSFRKKSRNAPMSELATCIHANIADLADDPDTSPLWSSVYDLIEDEGQVSWEYFPLDEDLLAEYE